MEAGERRYWFNFWNNTAFGMGKIAQFAHCINQASMLQVHGVAFDIHIQKVSPSFAGALTTSATGLQEFNDFQDLDILLREAVEITKASLEEQDERES